MGIFHQDCSSYAHYFGDANRAVSTIAVTIEDVMLEYESCELARGEHENVITQYRQGKVANYDYDIVRSQHQALDADVSYSVKWFQIHPRVRLVYVLFLPNFAVFPHPASHKPISAWSRFPAGCTGMKIGFAGEENLIAENLENFGVNVRNNELSKKIFFDYLTSHHMFTGKFEDIFSPEADAQSIVQVLPLELKHLTSTKTERLTLELSFSGVIRSPAGQQI